MKQLAVFALVACAGAAAGEISASIKDLSPGMLVRFTDETLLCPTQDLLERMIWAQEMDDRIELARMQVKHGGSCAKVTPKDVFEIIRTKMVSVAPERPGILVRAVRGPAKGLRAWALVTRVETVKK